MLTNEAITENNNKKNIEKPNIKKSDSQNAISLLLEDLRHNIQGVIKVDEPMSFHTTWRIGGPADILVSPLDEDEIPLILRLCYEYKTPVTIVSKGSNLLVSDKGIRGLVLKMDEALGGCHWHGNKIEAAAGVSLASLANESVNHGLTGLEWAAGIPGSLGGAVIMNAGAYGKCIADYITQLSIIEQDGCRKLINSQEAGFSYRCSKLQNSASIVTRIWLELKPGDGQKSKEEIKSLLKQRAEKQPLEYPSAGSVFKNPHNDFAGRLVEEANCKGLQVGQAQVSEKHSNFIVNLGGAKASDVLALIGQVQLKVKKKFAIDLETEVKVLGEQ